MDKPYTTKVPAHAVTRGMLLHNFGEPRPVSTTSWIQGAIDTATEHQYVGAMINGVPHFFNQPVEIVIGGSTGGGMR